MGVFEYIGVLVSVIMGLGITHLTTGTSKLIQHRSEVRLYLPHMLWTLNILIFILLIWWGMFSWSGHQTWFAYEYLFITLYAIVMFFLASLLYPWDMAKDVDVREHFFGNRTWFFSVLLVAWGIDVLATLVKADVGLRSIPTGYFGFIGVQMLIAIIGILSRNRIVHTVLPAIFLVIVLSLVLFSAQNQIGG
jgi:phage-related holin